MSWQALQFALDCDKVQSAAERLVLIEFANHADERGYTYPSIEFIASRCRLDRKTVRRGIASLIVRRTIYGTKKRCGPTGQVKVYRMPKTTYESGCKRDASKEGVRVPKESHKSPISGCKRDPNLEPDNLEPISGDATLSVINTTGKQTNALVSDVVLKKYQHQDTPARDHPKWPEFAKWCRSQCDKRGQPGESTEIGFWTWLSKQKPHWRNKVRPKPGGEHGYVLKGKFFTQEQANQHGRENPELITKFRPAIKRHGKIQITNIAHNSF